MLLVRLMRFGVISNTLGIIVKCFQMSNKLRTANLYNVFLLAN
jgi:hypothetical protein